MRKLSRLFEIVQILAATPAPMTGQNLATRLEVALRTIYRDIAALQAMRVPIEGERGLGYILRPGFTLPPLMFAIEEVEALVIALGLLDLRGDAELRGAAGRVSEKIVSAVPPPLRARLNTQQNGRALNVWGPTAPTQTTGLDLALARRAIRDELRLTLRYRNEAGAESQRIIRPIALIYYADTTNLVSWCETRQAIRHFRPDRVQEAALEGGHFRGQGDGLRRLWAAGWEETSTNKGAADHPAKPALT